MPRPVRVETTTTVTVELVIKATGIICPAEPDVGIPERYIEDISIYCIGDETDKLTSTGNNYIIAWCPDHPLGCYDWLEAVILRQAQAQLEEKLLDANS